MNGTTGSVRIAHVADTHLGYRALYKADPETGRNQRALDIERAYERVVDDILRREVDLVIHAGDVFHHTRPSWSALRAFVRQTRRLEAAGIPTVVIGGNHDTPRLRTSGSVFSVLDLALSGVTFVAGYEDQPIAFQELNLHLVAVPHGKLVDPIPPIVFPEPGWRNVLVTHGLVPGMKIRGHREPGEEEISDTLLDADFDYVALGHYHLFSKPRRNTWYAGATERMGWGDEEATPGYCLVALGAPGDEPVVEHVPIPVRPMKTLAPLDGEGRTARELADTVLGRLETLGQPDLNARIELRNTPRPIRREAEAILRREAHDLVWWIQVYSPADILAGFAGQRTEAAPTDVRALFEEFVTERTSNNSYDPAFAAAFRRQGRQALDEAIHRAESAAAEDPAA